MLRASAEHPSELVQYGSGASVRPRQSGICRFAMRPRTANSRAACCIGRLDGDEGSEQVDTLHGHHKVALIVLRGLLMVPRGVIARSDAIRCGLTMMGRLDQDQRQSVRSRPDAVLIQIVALHQWRPSIRAKAVVDAELHSGDGLLDVNPWHNFGETKNRSGQC